MGVISYTKVAKKYKGQWVAFANANTTEVVGYGKKLKTAIARALKNGYKHPFFERMPDDINAIYIGGFRVA